MEEKDLNLFEYMVVRLMDDISIHSNDESAFLVFTLLLHLLLRRDNMLADDYAKLSLSLISAFRCNPVMETIIRDYEKLNS